MLFTDFFGEEAARVLLYHQNLTKTGLMKIIADQFFSFVSGPVGISKKRFGFRVECFAEPQIFQGCSTPCENRGRAKTMAPESYSKIY